MQREWNLGATGDEMQLFRNTRQLYYRIRVRLKSVTESFILAKTIFGDLM